MPSSPGQSASQIVSAEQVGSLSRWGRVALAARAAMRTVIWFAPGPMRSRQQALGDLLAIDICSTLGMLAAAGARQLSAPVAESAENAAVAALAAPGRVPLLASDYAVLLAGTTVELAGASAPPDALDTGSPENGQAALGDLQTLLALGMQERGYEYPVPANFFSLPLWPAPGPDLRKVMAQWEGVLAAFNLQEFSQRFRHNAAGTGIDWADAQRRAEAWVRMTVPAGVAPVNVALGGVPPEAPRPTPNSGSFAPPIYRSAPSIFPATTQPTAPQPTPQQPDAPQFSMPPPVATSPASQPSYAQQAAAPATTAPMPAWRTPLPGSIRRASLTVAPQTPESSAIPTLRVPPPPRNAQGFADLEPYAKALASFIDALDPTTPFTLAIQGPAGSGRSVIGGMLKRRLLAKPSCRSEEPHLTLWFDANLPRSSPTLTASLMRAVAVELDEQRPPLKRHLRRLAWSLQPVANTWKYVMVIVAALMSILAVTAGAALMVPGIPVDLVPIKRDMLDILTMTTMGNGLMEVGVLAALTFLVAILELSGFARSCGKVLARYVHEPHDSDLQQARRQLGGLLREALPKGSRLVVFVEGLEQAGLVRVREFLESLKTTLRFQELVFVVLTDASALRKQAEEEEDPTGTVHQPPVLAKVVDLQLDLPARQTTRPTQEAKTSRSSSLRPSAGHARGLAAFWGPWSRDWRGDRRVEEVLQRTMYVDPPYLAPLVMVFWIFYWLPIAAFVNVQEWVYPSRGVRLFSRRKKSIWHVLLTLAALGHGVLAFQTLNGLLTNLHYVILYPDTKPFSMWVFLPMELVTMGSILLFGALIARAERERERSVLKEAREVLRSQVKEQHRGHAVALQAATALKGATRLREGEGTLVREAVVDEYLASEPDLLARFRAMVELASGLKSA